MNTFTTHQEALNRAPTPTMHTRFLGVVPSSSSFRGTYHRNVLNFHGIDEELAASVVPPVTVVLEGRSICHRICLHKHASYQSLAKALRQMFSDVYGDMGVAADTDLDITSAVPGHLVAYEDMEDDLLLAGDLKWKDFVRVVKRIRIIPVKANPRQASRRL
ncbi:auxin-responsive protein IAA33-like [Aristolochia californica]|uniref:auxin-responsive protein IAA33-like n=1 Tax=Aristolochia californica TaxID=171875 RepID=UPI0035DD63EA